MKHYVSNKYGVQVDDYSDCGMDAQAYDVAEMLYKKNSDGINAWLDFINQKYEYISGPSYTYTTISKVVKNLSEKYVDNNNVEEEDAFYEYVLPIIIGDDRLMQIMFQYACDGGGDSYTPLLLACLIAKGEGKSLRKVLSYLCNNRNMLFCRVGSIWCKTYKCFDELTCNSRSVHFNKCQISDNVKAALWESLDLCYSVLDRAESKIPILCIIDHK